MILSFIILPSCSFLNSIENSQETTASTGWLLLARFSGLEQKLLALGRNVPSITSWKNARSEATVGGLEVARFLPHSFVGGVALPHLLAVVANLDRKIGHFRVGRSSHRGTLGRGGIDGTCHQLRAGLRSFTKNGDAEGHIVEHWLGKGQVATLVVAVVS